MTPKFTSCLMVDREESVAVAAFFMVSWSLKNCNVVLNLQHAVLITVNRQLIAIKIANLTTENLAIELP